MRDEIRMIPIAQIRILNPRHRDKRKFEVIIQSIRDVGLKKPIQVSAREPGEGDGAGYDLVCGQGRIEAFQALGYLEIPAMVVELSREERLLRSLVENMARRFSTPAALMKEIERLKECGYSNVQIGRKIGITDTAVGGFLTLQKAGEGRLLDAALTGRVSVGVAIEIAKTDSLETQRALLKAYENKQLNQSAIRTVKKLMEKRRLLGRDREILYGRKVCTSAETLVNAYTRESRRQKLLVKKAKICEAKLVFIVTAFNRLRADDNFLNLIRAESLATMPKFLWQKVENKRKEAA
jgi:ParB family chromosome partitioning protein